MSDNVLDKFLIALGFDVDKKSTQEAESSIDGIRTSALAMGGILSAAFVKTGFAVKNTADDMTNLYNQSKQLGGVGVSELDAFRHAFEQVGGSASDAETTLANFESLLANAQLRGEGPWENLELAGISPDILLEAQNSIDLLERLSALYPQLGDQQRQLARQALGLGPGADLLLRQGPDEIQRLLADAEHLGVVTDEMAQNAEKLTQASMRFERAWENLANVFTGEASEGMASSIDRLADAITNLESVVAASGRFYGDNFDTLAPAATVGTAAAGAWGTSQILQRMGFTGTASMLRSVARFGATRVAAPLALASLWNLDEDITNMTGWDPKDHPATRWLFTPIGELFGSDGSGEPSGPDALNLNTPTPPQSDDLGFRLPDPSASSVFYETRDSVMPPLAAPASNTTNETVHIDRIELNVDGTGDPAAVADRVMAELNDVMLASLAQFQTASAG